MRTIGHWLWWGASIRRLRSRDDLGDVVHLIILEKVEIWFRGFLVCDFQTNGEYIYTAKNEAYFLCYLSCKVIVITVSMVQMRQLLFIPYLCLTFMSSTFFLSHYTLKFGIHSQVILQSTPFLYSCMAEGDTLPKLMDGKNMISTFMSAEKDVPTWLSHSNNSTYALWNCAW